MSSNLDLYPPSHLDGPLRPLRDLDPPPCTLRETFLLTICVYVFLEPTLYLKTLLATAFYLYVVLHTTSLYLLTSTLLDICVYVLLAASTFPSTIYTPNDTYLYVLAT